MVSHICYDSARCPGRGEGGGNDRGSSDLECSPEGAGAMIAQASRGAGKYEKLPVGIWPILEIPCLTSDGTGATSFQENCRKIVGLSLADYPPFTGHFLGDSWVLLHARNCPENRQIKSKFC